MAAAAGAAAAADPQLLLQQLVGHVQALYDSTPGSAPQREADRWLTGLVALEGAWPVLLRVVGPTPGEGQASPFDVRLTFIAAKIMQVRAFCHVESVDRFDDPLPVSFCLACWLTAPILPSYNPIHAQLKIQRDWRTCPLETRQAVQATLVSHLQRQALGCVLYCVKAGFLPARISI